MEFEYLDDLNIKSDPSDEAFKNLLLLLDVEELFNKENIKIIIEYKTSNIVFNEHINNIELLINLDDEEQSIIKAFYNLYHLIN